MKIKTFYAKSMAEAFRQIKQDLGEGALILSSRQVPMPGKRDGFQFEVSAATEDQEGEGRTSLGATPAPRCTPTAPARCAPPKSDPPATPFSAPHAHNPRPSPHQQPLDTNHLHDEIVQLRKMVYYFSQKHSLEREVPISSPYFDVYQDLLASDVDPWLACKFVDEEEPSPGTRPDAGPREKMLGRIRNHLRVDALPEDRRVVAAFLGPTGVGKTTTIAKLAARHCLELGRKVLLLTTDTYRIGAFEQLRTYSEILDVPCRAVHHVKQLSEELSRSRQFDTVLVDTTGKAPNDVGEIGHWARSLGGDGQVERHLVLAATSKMADLQEAVDRFGAFNPDHAVVTKIDETLSLGPILNVLARTRLPVSCITNGQNVPRDLIVPDAARLAAILAGQTHMKGAA